MATIYVRNKERGVTYVYDSTSYWDKDLKQPRSKRKLIGKLDPKTGEVVPTGKRGRKKAGTVNSDEASHNTADYKGLYEDAVHSLKIKDGLIEELRTRQGQLEQENRRLKSAIRKAASALAAAKGDI